MITGRRMGNPLRAGLLALGAAALIAAILVPSGAAAQSSEQVLYNFCAQSGCADGASPQAGLLMDTAGNFYGTTQSGGAFGQGVVFELSPDPTGTVYTETVLHSFCAQSNCADGAEPVAGLIIDAAGNLYGTTGIGGANGAGVVFALAPDGTETVLHSFCPQSGCADGAYPRAGLVTDAAGNLYGTTFQGGGSTACFGGCGVVFELTPDGAETVLYSFSSGDGQNPVAGLVMDGTGNLYGTTQGGGASGQGVVFELAPDGTETLLYSFSGADGANPYGGLVMDAAGNLYGTTYVGGTSGQGVVFELAPGGAENVLYAFCAQSGCSDGDGPLAGLVMDAAGNLYGTTYFGGTGGTVFELAPDGTETVLYSFCAQSGCTDGNLPQAGLVIDAAGNLYGTTSAGGASFGSGAVFALGGPPPPGAGRAPRLARGNSRPASPGR